MIEPAGLGLAHFGRLGQQVLGQQQQIVEINGPRGLQGILIPPIGHRRQMFFVGLGQRGGFLGPNRGRFPAADQIQQIAGPQQPVAHLDLAQHRSGDAFLIAAVVNGEGRRIAEQFDVAAQNSHAKRVERRHLGPLFGFFPQQRGRAFLHLVGRLVRKRHGQDPTGSNPVANQFGDAICHDARFAGSRARQYQQRPRKRIHGIVLGGVQIHARAIVKRTV